MTRTVTLGTRLRQARLRAGLSVAEVAARTSCKAHRIEIIEENVVDPLADEACELARVYGVSLDRVTRTTHHRQMVARIGHRLRMARVRSHLSVAEVVVRTGIRRVRLRAIEAGKADPYCDEARKLAMIYGVSLDNLLRGFLGYAARRQVAGQSRVASTKAHGTAD